MSTGFAAVVVLLVTSCAVTAGMLTRLGYCLPFAPVSEAAFVVCWIAQRGWVLQDQGGHTHVLLAGASSRLVVRAVKRKRGELSLHGVSLYSFLALVPTSC